MIRNLGQVAAIYIGSSAPRNTNLIWLDNTVVPFVFRAYDGSAWSEIATHKWVRAYVDGWLVTLPPRQLADDGDYMLINSNNVNYKITVKDFVKSAVGNPLDFKGVIRVSADFPNPSTLESGDMYVIITSPAGGTVTDPYSGKTFEDSEKIVWDEVTQSWESLGKIDITVDLTTSYSETEVTIHSSAGKETTIQGATDQLAGVMLPGQYSWLQALSNGSIVPGDPSLLTPLTPAHKHNYNDIINRLVSQQGTGESTIDPMSQKATTDALNLKFDKASVLQVSGAATDKVMSQKAVTDALKTLSDDFNNKLTNYLPLSGGTMKGNIVFNNNLFLSWKDTKGSTYQVLSMKSNDEINIGNAAFPLNLYSKEDLFHKRNGENAYRIYDAYNLPDPATLSGNNVFTGNNTFQAGKFNVGPFEVTSSGSLLSNISSPAGSAWARNLTFEANSDATSRSIFGGYNSVDNTSIGYAYIGIGDVNSSTAQYKFRPASLEVPIVWSLDDPNGNALVWSQSSTLAHLGRASGTTKIRSGNVNLIHTKGTTDYTILDSSNYTEFLPQNIAWTYGFVSHAVNNDEYDANSMIGVDKPKLLFNYYTPGKIVNAPTGMGCGNVLQIDGPYTSSYNEAALKTQLAFDIIHNVDNGTGRMWYRTANNKGMAVANWRRVLTADENIAGLSFDGNNYPAIIRVDGTTYPWLRANGNGFLPNVEKSLASGGASQLGSSSWAFLAGYIATVHTNKISFGTNGAFIDNQSGDSSYIGIGFYTSQNAACPVYVGSLCVSGGYANSVPNIPTNGIYSKGVIKSAAGFTSNFRQTNLNLAKTGNDVLYISSFVGGSTGSPGTDSNTGRTIDDGMFLTYFWGGDFAFQLAGDIDGSGIAYRSYAPSTGVSSLGWRFLADTNWVVSKINSSTSNFLPLTGGKLSGQLTVEYAGSTPLIVNNSYTNGVDSILNFRVKGVNKTLVGYSNGNGPFIQDASSNRCIMVKSDGAYFGTELGAGTKLALITDIPTVSGYLPLSGGTLTGTLKINSGGHEPLIINNSASAGEAYVVTKTQGTTRGVMGWNSSLGMFLQDNRGYTFSVKADGVYFGASSSTLTKLPTSTDLSGYLPLAGGTMTGALTMSSRRHNIVVDVVGGAGNTWDEGAGALSIQVPNDSGQTPLLLARRSGAAINTVVAAERLLSMELLDNGHFFIIGMSGSKALQLDWTSGKAGTGKLFGKTIATTDQIPSIPSISISNSGSGNAVTAISASGHTLTVTKGATYLTSSSLDGYATQTWANGQFAPLSRFNTSTGYTTIKVTGQEFNFDSANPEIYMNYRTLSGSTAVTKITWKGGSNSTLCEGRWGNLYMNDNLVATQSWAAEKFPNKTGTGASGTWGISISGNATTATTASKLGSTTIGGSAKPIYLNSGTPTACSATVGSTTVPVYMNAGTITQCSTTLGVSITGNAATATNSTQLGGTAASSYVKANDNISRLTNDSGFITSSALNGYATQAWVNSQNFVKSTSTKKVTDIQPVDALPATQVSGVLYLVFG